MTFKNLQQSTIQGKTAGLPSVSPNTTIKAFRNAGAAVSPLGFALTYGEAANSAQLPTASSKAQDIIGFSIYSSNHVNDYPENNGYTYKTGEMIDVLIGGFITLIAKNGATRGETVHIYKATGEIAGGTADSTNTIELLGCVWEEDVASGKVGTVHVRNLGLHYGKGA